jgi:hypothetical protein
MGSSGFCLTREVPPQRRHDPRPPSGPGPTRPRRGGCRAEGSTIGMTAPFSGPQEARGLQAKMPGVRDPRPLGAAMDSSALLVGGNKYCHNGGLTLARLRRPKSPRGAARGVRDGHDGPPSWSPRRRQFAGEMLQGLGVRALWGQQWARLPMADDPCGHKGMCDLQQHRWAAALQRHKRLVADAPNHALGGEVAVAADHALAVRAPARRAAGRGGMRHANSATARKYRPARPTSGCAPRSPAPARAFPRPDRVRARGRARRGAPPCHELVLRSRYWRSSCAASSISLCRHSAAR